MSKARSIAKNILFTFTGDNVAKVLSLFLTIFIARLLGDVDFGKFSFALSFTGLFIILIDLGTQVLIIRKINQREMDAKTVLGNILSLKIFMSVITVSLIFIIINILDYDSTTRIGVYIAALAVVFESFSRTLAASFQAFERMEYPAMTKVFRVFLRFVVTLPLLFAGFNFNAILLVYLFVQVVNMMSNIYLYTTRIGSIRIYCNLPVIKAFIKEALPFALSGMFVIIYFRVDITMLSIMTNDAVVGWYSAAYHLLDAVITIPIAFSVALLPVAIQYIQKSRNKTIQLYQKAVRYSGFLAYPIAFCTTVLAKPIISLIYGDQYEAAGTALQILVWTIIPLFTVYVMGVMMIALKKEKTAMWVLLGNSVANILFNLMLIPRFGLIGAALATIGAEIIYFTMYYHIIKKYLAGLRLASLHYKPLIASAITALLLYFTDSIHVLIRILIGAVLYIGLLFIMRSFTGEDMRLIRKILKSKKDISDVNA